MHSISGKRKKNKGKNKKPTEPPAEEKKEGEECTFHGFAWGNCATPVSCPGATRLNCAEGLNCCWQWKEHGWVANLPSILPTLPSPTFTSTHTCTLFIWVTLMDTYLTRVNFLSELGKNKAIKSTYELVAHQVRSYSNFCISETIIHPGEVMWEQGVLFKNTTECPNQILNPVCLIQRNPAW